jgi:C4-dicarboxylate-specific signal transduction histidine kinase
MPALAARSAVERLQGELIDCQRHALAGVVATMLVHEFNNLMQPVVMRAQDALSREDRRAMLKALQTTCERTTLALEAAQQLMRLVNHRPAPAEPCSLAEAVCEALGIAGARPFEKDGIHMAVAVPPELRVMARRVLLVQLLVNLLLHLRGGERRRGGAISLEAKAVDSRVLVELRDSLSPLDPAHVRDVIAPFLSTSVREEPCDIHGAGLEMNVCRTIAQFHDATLKIRAGHGDGVTYVLDWPGADGAR